MRRDVVSTPAAGPSREAEIAARLRIVVGRLARAVRQHASGGLTPSETSALASIEAHQPVRLSELAAVENVAPPMMSRVVDRLVRTGLVSRSPDAADARACLLSLTESGRRTLAELRQSRAAALAERIARLAPEQVDAIEAALPALEALAAEPPSAR